MLVAEHWQLLYCKSSSVEQWFIAMALNSSIWAFLFNLEEERGLMSSTALKLVFEREGKSKYEGYPWVYERGTIRLLGTAGDWT